MNLSFQINGTVVTAPLQLWLVGVIALLNEPTLIRLGELVSEQVRQAAPRVITPPSISVPS